MKLSLPDIKAGYDRYLLVVVSLLSVGAAVWLTGSATEAREKAKAPTQTGTQEPFAVAPEIETLKSDKATLANRKPWQESKASPFVSRIYLLKDDRLVDILESGTDLFPGIPNAWILEHGLDYLDERLPERDPDNDGFTNTEEFADKTNPRDAASKPEPWRKLRLVDAVIEKLRFKFMGLPRGSLETASINTVSAENPAQLSGSTQFYPRTSKKVKTITGDHDVDLRTILIAEKGPSGEDVFQVTPFHFKGAELRKQFNEATSREEQVAVAIVVNTADNKTLELKQSEIADSPYAKATLLDLTRPDAREIEVRVGAVFDMGTPERYKLVDVSEENATIEVLGSGAKHVIPKAAVPAPQATPEEAQPQ